MSRRGYGKVPENEGLPMSEKKRGKQPAQGQRVPLVPSTLHRTTGGKQATIDIMRSFSPSPPRERARGNVKTFDLTSRTTTTSRLTSC